MGNDDDGGSAAKRAILARRAKFVAVALAGIACGKEHAEPQPEPRVCLSAAVPEDAGPPPQPCLSVPIPTATTKPDAAPHPCLKMVVPTPTNQKKDQ